MTDRRPLLRRSVLAGGLGTVALAATGVSLALRAGKPASGKLVPQLLTARPFYVAHRGGSADWPEMSMLAYRSSVERGVDALEISLARSSDGVWFGLHDGTFDRTSGTTGVKASDLTWAQIGSLRIRPPGSGAAGQKAQPYVRLEDLTDAYASTHTIFIDPKAVEPVHFNELLGILEKAVNEPAHSFIAKSYATAKTWPRLARQFGYRTWGYYYGAEIASGATALASTQERWDLLGLDVDAPTQVWQQVLALGKPVAAHVVADRAAAQRAIAAGAQGLVVSGVLEVLPAP